MATPVNPIIDRMFWLCAGFSLGAMFVILRGRRTL